MSMAFLISLGAFLLLGAIGMPIAIAAFAGSIAYMFMSGQDVGLVAEQALNGLFNSYVLLAVPLFILAANFMNAGTISDRLLTFCIAIVGRFRGGLAHVNVLASVIFSGMSGSAIADAAGIGRVIIELMTRDNRYPGGYAAALTAASSVIGPIIPPSIPMILYALISGTSIGYLFLAGIVPGLFMALVLMVLNVIVARKRDFKRDEVVPLRKIPRLTMRAFPALMLPVILLYGIYGGVTTPTEAAAIAAIYALVLAGLFYRSVSWKDFYALVLDGAKSTSVVGLIIASALVLNYLVASENIPALVADSLSATQMSPLMFLLMINLIILVLGCLFDATTLLLIVVPLFLPTASMLGIDLVHFGVVITINIMIGLITPPYGILLFVLNGVTGIPLRDIIREIWPFVFALLCALIVLVLIPDMVLWLPRMFGYVG
ncbi:MULTISPECIES: TRAP transporter large permease [Thalassospira]|uniref:TRAP transporter large permease protein n=3 Tax=Thalassospira TaxID=168934 RepID=A0A358HYF6_9PROT|nr:MULTISPECIES: TRAP transporter large permease [Thalassospira]MBV17344.1 TRAP transporter large permease [Thalassospira sp.]PKR58782.1 TRAP transporter large permease [Thalassospira lohafexi]RCK18970.1 permease [Thalassospira lucentensis MCCC 1A00383 = DSM 14000]HBV00211.1 TRAP transporter large permease [Thalassospira lucentensis]|tara:strand:- start:25135 stop:26430 length:1296 start_codon:yes stop_codon:yes gene_type:complete